VVFDDTEESEVTGHNDNCDYPCDQSSCSCEDGTAETCAESEEEGDECETACNGVKDHNTSESLSGVFRGGVKACLVDGGHDIVWVVADVYSRAPILISARRRVSIWVSNIEMTGEDLPCGSNIENTMAKGSKGDARVTESRAVGECHLQDGDIVHNWRRDGCDEEKNCGDKEEERRNVMKDAGFRHFEWFWVCCRGVGELT
jgi:hypothetical protein